MNPLRRFCQWLRRLFGTRRPPETPRERLVRAQLLRQRAEKQTLETRVAWDAAKRALAEAERTGDDDAIERVRHDERLARLDYDAAKAAERAIRSDADAARVAEPSDVQPIVVTADELEDAMERRFRAHRLRLAQQEMLVVHRAIEREMHTDLARAHGVAIDQTIPVEEAIVVLDDAPAEAQRPGERSEKVPA